MSDKELIKGLKSGDKAPLKMIYENYKGDFFRFLNRYEVPLHSLEDIFQDAILVLFQKASSGKLDQINSSLKTYLFSIGKYMVFEQYRKDKKKVDSPEDYIFDKADNTAFNMVQQRSDINPLQKRILAGFARLGAKCQEVLKLFYYRGFTIEEIMEHLEYPNKNVVKSQKSRCLKTLKAHIHEQKD